MTTSAVARLRAPDVVAVRRLVNDHIAHAGERMDADQETELYEFMCECGDLHCDGKVTLTPAEFRETVPGWVRAH